MCELASTWLQFPSPLFTDYFLPPLLTSPPLSSFSPSPEVLSGSQFWYDRLVGSDDMERVNGCHWQWKSYCSSSQVRKIFVTIQSPRCLEKQGNTQRGKVTQHLPKVKGCLRHPQHSGCLVTFFPVELWFESDDEPQSSQDFCRICFHGGGGREVPVEACIHALLMGRSGGESAGGELWRLLCITIAYSCTTKNCVSPLCCLGLNWVYRLAVGHTQYMRAN